MIFLNPTILFGLLAASIPVLLHFLNLRKIKKIEFSTLNFLKELQKSKIKRIKFKQWFLLALRILIILFLVGSFARPTLETISISGTGSIVKTTAIFILDDSYSMSVVDENGSHLNQAKEIILDLITDYNEGDDIILILASSPTYKLESKNFKQLIKDVRDINISYITNSIFESMSEASQIIKNSSNYNKEVYLFSDFQKSTSIDFQTVKENGDLSFDEKTKLYLFKFGKREVKNICINDLKADNQIFELNKKITLRANASNFSNQSYNDALISIFLNGEVHAYQNTSIPAGTLKEITFSATLKQTGIIELLAELEVDEVEYDNRFYHTINVPENINVLIISDNDSESKYVELALLTSSENIFKLQKIKSSEINSVNLNSFDCIFLVGLEDKENIKQLTQFVESGGQLIITPSSKNKSEYLNLFLNELNIPELGDLQNISSQDQFITFEEINLDHPIFDNIFDKETNKKFESPEIKKYYKTSLKGKGESIITLLDGSSFLSEFQFKDGKLFLFNVAPALSWSDFPIKSIFAPLMNRSVYYLTSNKNSYVSYRAGDKIEIDISSISIPQIKIVRPDKSEEFVKLETNLKYYTYNKSDLIGLYKFYSGQELIDVVTVNVNSVESDLKNITQGEFEDYLHDNGFKGNLLQMDNKNFKNDISQARYGSELWKLFLIITLLLALVEMFIARSAKKDLAEINE